MFSRRGIMKAMGAATAAPVLEKLTTVPGSAGGGVGIPYPPSTNEGLAIKSISHPQLSMRLMSPWQAAQFALRDPAALARARSISFKRNRYICALDPDIAVIRSWSPMAKVAFQRQRQVDREIEGETVEQVWDTLAHVRDKMNNLMGAL